MVSEIERSTQTERWSFTNLDLTKAFWTEVVHEPSDLKVTD